LSGWQELPHPWAERGSHGRYGTYYRSSLSGRADALYVVNDALGSLLLRANEVIDQVGLRGHLSDCPAKLSTSVDGGKADLALQHSEFSHSLGLQQT
jgi:hypothetical protein